MKGAAIGIDLGTHSACAAIAVPGGSVRLIPNRWGTTSTPSAVNWGNNHTLQDPLVSLLLTLREDAEAHLKDFVTSCILAVPVNLSGEQKESVVKAANAAGIEEVGMIPGPCAAALGLSCRGRTLVLDLGAGTTLSVVEFGEGDGRVLESVETGLPGGRDFDAALAAWLRERLRLSLKEGDPRQSALCREAEQIKIALSKTKSLRWTPPALENGGTALSTEDWPSPVLTVYREDLECLIRFSLRQIIHTACRLWTQYAPTHLLPTGGSGVIPLFQTILQQEGPQPKHQLHGTEDAVVRGAAIQASRGVPSRGGQDVSSDETKNLAEQIRVLKLSLLDIETLLTHSQQDQLHLLFQRAESVPPDPKLLQLIEGLAHDLKQAVE